MDRFAKIFLPGQIWRILMGDISCKNFFFGRMLKMICALFQQVVVANDTPGPSIIFFEENIITITCFSPDHSTAAWPVVLRDFFETTISVRMEGDEILI